jgi:hypothetical protein
MGANTYLRPAHGASSVGAPPADDEVDIDESWFDLAATLDVLGLDGERVVTGNIYLMTDEDAEDEGLYKGWVDPDEVERNWRLLRAVTFERFLAAYAGTPNGRSTNDHGVDEYLEAHFTSLVEVYRTAAAAKAGMMFRGVVM